MRRKQESIIGNLKSDFPDIKLGLVLQRIPFTKITREIQRVQKGTEKKHCEPS
jgi:hypothetical protein